MRMGLLSLIAGECFFFFFNYMLDDELNPIWAEYLMFCVRNWVFRKALPYPHQSSEKEKTEKNLSKASPSSPSLQSNNSATQHADGVSFKRSCKQTDVTLFRFSALTFNPHKIHYSVPWAQEVEGHKNIVVHGPLNLISMLDFWRDLQHAKNISNNDNSSNNNKQGHVDRSPVFPESISYRATNPLYAEEGYEIVLQEGRGASSVNILNHDGVVCMKAEIRM